MSGIGESIPVYQRYHPMTVGDQRVMVIKAIEWKGPEAATFP